MLLLLCLSGCSGQRLLIEKDQPMASSEIAIAGEILWQTRLPSPPATNMVAGFGYIFLPLANRQIFIIETTSGKKIRRIYTDFFIESVSLGPECLYLTGISDWNAVVGYELRKLDRLFEKSADPLGGNLLYTSMGVLFLTNTGKLFLLNALTGEKKFSVELNGLPSGFSLLGSSLVAVSLQQGTLLFITLDSLKIAHKIELQELFESPPVFYDIVVQAGLNGTIFGIDTSGTVIFSTTLAGMFTSNPAVDENFIYAVSRDGGIFKLDKKNGEQLAETKLKGPVFAPPILVGNSIIICNLYGELSILERENLGFQKAIKLRGTISYPPIYYKNRLFVATGDGYLYAIE